MTTPRMRAGTTDRQDAVDRLSRHFAEGRLDTSEFDTRVGKAYAATYLDELPELLEDLPEARVELAKAGAGWPHNAAAGTPAGWQGRRPEQWGAPFQRPPRWLGVAVLIGLLFTVGALTHGFVLFPLIWLAFAFSAAGHRRQHWNRQRFDRQHFDRQHSGRLDRAPHRNVQPWNGPDWNR